MKIVKETIRVQFDRGRSYILLCLCGAVLINILPFPYFGLETGYTEPVFSVTSTNEPLYKVLGKISEATGYQIEITKSWENTSITADIKNSTLEQGIKKVVSLLGNPNYAIVKNDSVKKVEIKIFDAFPGHSSTVTDSSAKHRQGKNGGVLDPDAALRRQNEVIGVAAGAKAHLILEMPPPLEMPPLLEMPPPIEMVPPEMPPQSEVTPPAMVPPR
jgi:hypothetical protein